MKKQKDILIFIALFVICLVTVFDGIFISLLIFKKGELVTLNYKETSNLSYKVYLQDNEFYPEESLGEDYSLIASSIDKLEVSFDYLLNTSGIVTGESYYTINSKIVAYQKDDTSGKKVWDYERLIKDKQVETFDVDTVELKVGDTFTIDYQEYKKLMDDFKNKYAVSLVGNLVIEIEVKSDLNYSSFKESADLSSRTLTLTIPLTEQIVKITKGTLPNGTSSVSEQMDSTIDYSKLSVSAFCFIAGVYLSVCLGTMAVKMIGYDSKYHQTLHKILKTYNSIIVNVEKTSFDKNENIVQVSNFDELLDAQSELRTPILHCETKPNKESIFYLHYDKTTLVYTLKSELTDQTKKVKKNEKHAK